MGAHMNGLLDQMSKNETKHLSEAIRSMAVDAALDGNWREVCLFYTNSRQLAMFVERGKHIVKRTARSMEEQAEWEQIQQDGSSRKEVLPALREITTKCKCLVW